MWTPLIVKGAAGSGKTTIALHRIAYLVYTHEKSFKPENFMIIAPNRLFLNYISEVLPEKSFIPREDFAPLIYLKFRIYGLDEKIPVRHIVIDEAQDFSIFQLYVLKQIIKDSSFTILGDLCQGIHSYRGLRDWEDVSTYVFKGQKSRFLTLKTSYRTTVEIIETANNVIRKLKDFKLAEARPVIRHGEKVSVEKRNSEKEIASEIEKKIHGFRQDGFKSIAIICKTLDECKVMRNLLSKFGNELQVITGKESEYRSGLVIVPSFLAKGLEFDAVIIANAGAEQYREEELDIKLLYVAMTRALHKLVIYYTGRLSPLLQ